MNFALLQNLKIKRCFSCKLLLNTLPGKWWCRVQFSVSWYRVTRFPYMFIFIFNSMEINKTLTRKKSKAEQSQQPQSWIKEIQLCLLSFHLFNKKTQNYVHRADKEILSRFHRTHLLYHPQITCGYSLHAPQDELFMHLSRRKYKLWYTYIHIQRWTRTPTPRGF